MKISLALKRKEVTRSGAQWTSSHTSPRAELLLFFPQQGGPAKKVFVATTDHGKESGKSGR